jgi:hypothetical protein
MAILTSAKSIVSNGPTTATTALATAPGGPIMDYAGNATLLVLKLEEANVLATKMKQDTDTVQPDPNLALLNAILAQLV